MTRDQIEEMFVRAAETEAKLPAVKGLREQWGRYSLPWVHETADITMRRREIGDRLIDGDDPLGEWGKGVSKVLAEWERRAKTSEIVNWEACLNITREFVSDPKRRRALWAWSMAKAGTLNERSFTKWCRKVEGVTDETGRRRKDAAVTEILQAFVGKDDLRGEIVQSGVLPVGPEIEHVFATIEGQRIQTVTHHDQRVYTWRDDPAFEAFAAKRKAEQAKRKAA